MDTGVSKYEMLGLLLLLFACVANGENWALDFVVQDDNFRVRNGVTISENVLTSILQYPHLEYETNTDDTPQQNYDACRFVCEDIGNLCTGFAFCATSACSSKRCVLGFSKGLAEIYKPDVILHLNHLSDQLIDERQIQIMGKDRAHEFTAQWKIWHTYFTAYQWNGVVFEANQPADAASKDYYAVKRVSGDDTDTALSTGPPTFAPIAIPPTDPPSTPTGFPTAAPVDQPTFSPTPKPTPFPTLDYGDIKPGGYIGLGLFGLALAVFLAYVAYVYFYT